MKSIYLILFFTFYSFSISQVTLDNIPKKNKIKANEPIFPKIDFNKFKNVNKNNLLGIDDPNFKDDLIKQIQNRLDALHPNVKNGISFSFYSGKTGQFNYATGYSDKYIGEKLTSDMPLQIASITKVFVATLIFKLQEEGKLSIDDPISKYLDNIPNVNMSLRIQQLLNHSSQIFDVFNGFPELYLTTYLNPMALPSLDSVLKSLPPYSFPQGVTNQYSNTNYILLAKIVEKVTGKNFEEYLDEIILTPLDLQNTTFVKGDNEPSNIATGWFEDNYIYFGITKVNDNDLYKLYELGFGMANMVATPADITKFGYNLMNGNIINETSFATMTEQFSFNEADQTAYGNGLFFTKLGVSDCYFHNGSLIGYQSYLFTIPSEDIAFSFVINTANGGWVYNNNGLQEVLESVLFECFDITETNSFNTEIANFTIIEETNDNIVKNGETIDLEFTLRDISKRYSSMLANLSLSGETHKIEDLTPIMIDTVYSDGYSNIESRFKIKVNDDVIGDEIKLDLNIDDVSGNSPIMKLPFSIPINKDKKSLNFSSYETRVEVPANTFELDKDWSFETDFKVNGRGKELGQSQNISTIFAYSQSFVVYVIDSYLVVSIITENGQNPVYLYQSLLSFKKWYHLAVTFKDNGTVKFYLDGVEINLTIVNQQSPMGKLIDSRPKMCVVGNGANKYITSYPFNGSIDNVRLWSKALLPNEVNQELSSDKYSDLYFAYNFDIGYGLNVKDITGQRNGIRYTLFENNRELATSVEHNFDTKVSIELFPLPSNDKLNVKSDEYITSFTIYDLAGNEVFTKKVKKSKNFEIDISKFTSNIYLLKCYAEEKEFSNIFIKN